MTRHHPEIRAVPGKPDGWEVLSTKGCCVFEWERKGTRGGVVYCDARQHDSCRREVSDYAASRGYAVVVRGGGMR